MTTAHIIHGADLAKALKEKIHHHVQLLKEDFGRAPKLQTIIVGDNPASHIYVNSKMAQCQEVGIVGNFLHLPAETSTEALLEKICHFNEDKATDGILVQLPLPKPMRRHLIYNAVDPQKDVDGFNALNVGYLQQGNPIFTPCTPLACHYILKKYVEDLTGKNVLIIGRSDIVGKPIANMLMNEDCTITVAHSMTRHIEKHCANADIVVAAAGAHHLVRGFWLKKDAVVIDVGINRLSNGEIVGDVNVEEALKVASYITPVPGGVGPLTIAFLLYNTLKAFCLRQGREVPVIF